MSGERSIGIVAGAGPFAGLDLLSKILDQTMAATDQEHLTIASLSKPNQIPDRTEYLLGARSINPADAIADQILGLEKIGAQVIGIPCNTAHAPAIFDIVIQRLGAADSKVLLLHMIEEVALFLMRNHCGVKNVGVLSTTGTFRAGIYPAALAKHGYRVLVPDESIQEQVVHPAIYDPGHGIKACGRATPEAIERLFEAARHLHSKGAEALILGCTEIPLAIEGPLLHGMTVIDPTLVLARALIHASNPRKLKPLYPAPV